MRAGRGAGPGWTARPYGFRRAAATARATAAQAPAQAAKKPQKRELSSDEIMALP
jgi:hypothetical protein